jgi:hypothetical protein
MADKEGESAWRSALGRRGVPGLRRGLHGRIGRAGPTLSERTPSKAGVRRELPAGRANGAFVPWEDTQGAGERRRRRGPGGSTSLFALAVGPPPSGPGDQVASPAPWAWRARASLRGRGPEQGTQCPAGGPSTSGPRRWSRVSAAPRRTDESPPFQRRTPEPGP